MTTNNAEMRGRHRAITADRVTVGPVVTTLANVVPERVSWLWPGRLAAGKIAILTGDPSTGKSTLALDLAARVTTGATWPDGAEASSPGGVLLLTAEDGIADTVAPRLAAAGGDLNRVHVLQAIAANTANGPVERMPVLDADLGAIYESICRFDCRLVVVDVLMAYLSAGADSHRDQDIRRVLSPLAKMAEATSACILLLRHMNKSSGGPAIYRGGGSIGITGAARSEFLVATDRDDQTGQRRIMATVKSNLAATPPALAFHIIADARYGCGRIAWEEQPLPSSVTAEALLQAPRESDSASERHEALNWLTAFLVEKGGNCQTKHLKAACENAGFNWNTVRKHLPKIADPVNSGFGPSKQHAWTLKT